MRRLPRAQVLAVLPLLLALSACAPGGDVVLQGADVVLVTVDTLRADHLGVYGHDRPTSPRIDALAREGVLFRHALAQAPWTLPSVASMHTGLYPSQHGANHFRRALDEGFVTLAEILRDAGYHTVGVVSHDFTGRKYGLDQGFDEFDQILLQTSADTTSPALAERAIEMVEAAPDGERLFLWVHFFDPHYDYVRHPEYGFADSYPGPLPDETVEVRDIRRLRDAVTEVDQAYVRAVYDEEIRLTDEWIGRLLDGVREQRGKRPTLTVLTADHGESFFENGRLGHGKDVVEPLVHVPLIIVGDGIEGGRMVDVTVEVRSVARTILDLVGVASGGLGGGLNLLEFQKTVRSPVAFSEGSHARGRDQRKIAAVRGGWKLVYRIDSDRYELYDLQADPEESHPVDPELDERASAAWSALFAAIDAFREQAEYEPTGAEVELTTEERQRLEALGYIQ